MSDRCSEIVRDSSYTGNYIPSGRQLPRTPPMMDVKRHLDFCNEDQNEQSEEAGRDQERMFDFTTLKTKTEPDEPNSMLKGMKGYQLTPGDLEFIEKMKEEKLVKELQGELEETQRSLKKEMMAFELACAAREKAQAELKKFPSCEELSDWIKAVLAVTSTSAELTDADAKSLLAMVTKENVQRAMDEKRVEIARVEKMVANKRKKEAKERGQLEKRIASEQTKVQGLMSQLSALKSELAQQEEAYKALEMQINTQETPENKAEEASEEAQDTKVKRRGKERKKAVKSTEKLQDATNQSRSTRSKDDNQTSAQRSTKQAAAAAEEAGLRRSKRIASRR